MFLTSPTSTSAAKIASMALYLELILPGQEARQQGNREDGEPGLHPKLRSKLDSPAEQMNVQDKMYLINQTHTG